MLVLINKINKNYSVQNVPLDSERSLGNVVETVKESPKSKIIMVQKAPDCGVR